MTENYEVVIIGGGPAGLAAAIETGRAGAKTLLVDENARPGGQLFKQIHKFFGSRNHRAGIRGIDIGKELLEQTEAAGVEVWLRSTVAGILSDKRIHIVREDASGKSLRTVSAERILLATGGQESSIPFQGWTMPGVMGAGCAQTMINVNRVLPGRRALIVGSGNVGLIVSYQLMQAGADVVGIVEAADHIGGYGVHAAKIRRAGVPIYLSHTIIRAEGAGQGVERAVIGKLGPDGRALPGSEIILEVDTICLAVGLSPSSKLAQMCGLRMDFVPALGGWLPIHDENMESPARGFYVAGDLAGVEEANTAMDEGRLAGIAIAESLGRLTSAEADARKREIRDRLRALRLGPFGEKRLHAKDQIMREVSYELWY